MNNFQKRRFLPLIVPILVVVLCNSCATLIYTNKQKVTFTSDPPGAEVYVGGVSTNKVTPCEIMVKRKVKADSTHVKNQQVYTLKKDGYFDFQLKDIAKKRFGPPIIYITAALSSASTYAFLVPLTLIGLPIDIATGSLLKYQKEINAGSLIKSDGVREKIVYVKNATAQQKEPERLAKMYAVVIGISEYNDKTINLEFADDDAKLFYNHLRSPAGGLLNEDQVTLLLNKNASRANIIKALNTQFKNAYEEDLVLVYIASHGMPSSTGNKLYFLGSDTDIDNLEGTAISQSDILDAINNCKAQKKIWVADACHSGGVGLSSAGMRGNQSVANSNMVNGLMTQIANYKDNLILLTASSAGETSQESPNWGGGHGVFTYFLVQGLKGSADANKNNFVDIRELYEYVRDKVSKETNKKQYPELKGSYKDHFPMSIVIPK